MRWDNGRAGACSRRSSCLLLVSMIYSQNKGGMPVKVRIQTLWKVPVYCAVSSWISFYLTVYLGGFFFTVRTVGADGVTQLSADPVRSVIFNGVLFLLVLLVGGLWAFRSMTKAEVVVSAGIASGIYLLIVLAQLYIPNFPLSLSITMAYIQNWTGTLSSFLLKLTDNLTLSVILSSFAPLLFVPFGRKSHT